MILVIILMILLQVGCSGEDRIEELEQKLDNKENEDDCENCETDKR